MKDAYFRQLLEHQQNRLCVIQSKNQKIAIRLISIYLSISNTSSAASDIFEFSIIFLYIFFCCNFRLVPSRTCHTYIYIQIFAKSPKKKRNRSRPPQFNIRMCTLCTRQSVTNERPNAIYPCTFIILCIFNSNR